MDPSGVPLDAPSPGGPSRKKAEVDYKFCLLCSNLLYPKEDRMTNTLNYICKACGQVQPAEASCTYRNQLGSTVTETAGVTTDVANDPTVGASFKGLVPYLLKLSLDPVLCSDCDDSLRMTDLVEDHDTLALDACTHASDAGKSIPDPPEMAMDEMPDSLKLILKGRAELPGKVARRLLEYKTHLSNVKTQMSDFVAKTAEMSSFIDSPSAIEEEAQGRKDIIRQLHRDVVQFSGRVCDLPIRLHNLGKMCKAVDDKIMLLAITQLQDKIRGMPNEIMLPRSTQRCPKCRNTDAVHFQSQQRTNETGMKLYYVCLECNHVYTIV